MGSILSIYHRVKQQGWKKVRIVNTGQISPNERMMRECATQYYHAFQEGQDGLVLTPELNNPNFEEIVDNIKNGLPYDHIHDRSTT